MKRIIALMLSFFVSAHLVSAPTSPNKKDSLEAILRELRPIENNIQLALGKACNIQQNTIDILNNVNTPIPSQLDVIESLLDTISGSGCVSTRLTSADISGGMITINSSGNYCLATDLTTNISITADCVELDLNQRCLTGTINVTSDNVSVMNGNILAPAGTGNAITIASTASNAHIEYVEIRGSDSNGTDIFQQVHGGILVQGPKAQINNCIITTGSIVNTGNLGQQTGGTGIELQSTSYSVIEDTIIKTGNGADASGIGNAPVDGGNGGTGILVSGNSSYCLINNVVLSTGNGGGAGLFFPIAGAAGNGGMAIWLTGSANRNTILNCIIESTGDAGAQSGFDSSGGHGVLINSTVNSTLVRLCNITNTGQSSFQVITSIPTTNSGRAIQDLNVATSSTSGSSMIFDNYASNIANTSVNYNIHATGVEGGFDATTSTITHNNVYFK